jgi:outer membrane putative beta-barrel porin/alpha-amylase
MSKTSTLCLTLSILVSVTSFGQTPFPPPFPPTVGGPCPTSNSTRQTIPTISPDLICIVPQVYGAGGLVGVDHNGPLGSTDVASPAFKHAVHFLAASLASLSPLTAEIGSQLNQGFLPVTSPASGFVFSFNASQGVELVTARNLGPLFSEGVQPVGRHKLVLAFGYQYFDFDKIENVHLKNFGAVFHNEFELCPNPNAVGITCYTNSNGVSVPVINKDFIATQNRIDLKFHQFTVVGTFGLTNRLDLSVAIPILDARMDMISDATIDSIESTDPTIVPTCCVNQFNPSPLQPGETLGPLFTSPTNGFQFYNQASFVRGGSAVGIGDLVLRGKFQALKTEKAGLGVGLDVHVPTGNELNFLGSGTWGFRPFVAFSYSNRVSPHASLGTQFNGNSILAGSVSTDTKAHLPNVISYTAGVDVGITRRLSISADYLGQVLLNENTISEAVSVTDFSNVSHSDIKSSNANINQASVAIGGRVNLFRKLIFTANVLFRVNNAGLHYKPVPLAGLAYTF